MKKIAIIGGALCMLACFPAHAQLSVNLGIGEPAYPEPVYPSPVYVDQPAPVYVRGHDYPAYYHGRHFHHQVDRHYRGHR